MMQTRNIFKKLGQNTAKTWNGDKPVSPVIDNSTQPVSQSFLKNTEVQSGHVSNSSTQSFVKSPTLEHKADDIPSIGRHSQQEIPRNNWKEDLRFKYTGSQVDIIKFKIASSEVLSKTILSDPVVKASGEIILQHSQYVQKNPPQNNEEWYKTVKIANDLAEVRLKHIDAVKLSNPDLSIPFESIDNVVLNDKSIMEDVDKPDLSSSPSTTSQVKDPTESKVEKQVNLNF